MMTVRLLCGKGNELYGKWSTLGYMAPFNLNTDAINDLGCLLWFQSMELAAIPSYHGNHHEQIHAAVPGVGQ